MRDTFYWTAGDQQPNANPEEIEFTRNQRDISVGVSPGVGVSVLCWWWWGGICG
ncbi:hypothetical protein ACWEOA_20660 [Streptomyces sp. NPDC004457]